MSEVRLQGLYFIIFLAVVMMMFVVAMLKSNLERISKQNIYVRIKGNSISPCLAGGPLARVLMENFHRT